MSQTNLNSKDKMGAISFDSIVSFNSTNKKHFNIERIKNIFSKHTEMRKVTRYLQKVISSSPVRPHECRNFFAAVHEMVLTCSLGVLGSARENGLGELARISASVHLGDGIIHIQEDIHQKVKSDIINGTGDISFIIHLFRMIDRRYHSVNAAEKLYQNIRQRVNDLKDFQENEDKMELSSRKDLLSEVVLKESWALIRDAKQVLSDMVDRDKKKNTVHDLNEAISVIKTEIEKISLYFSDKLVFIIRAKYTNKLPPQVKKKVDDSIIKLGKILREKLHMLYRLMDNEYIQKDDTFKGIAENLLLTLMFAIQTVPYRDFFSTSASNHILEKLQPFALYASLVYDIDSEDISTFSFSEDTSFDLRYIPDIQGKSLGYVVELLEGLNDNHQITDSILKKLYDHLMVDVENWLNKNPDSSSDRKSVVVLKKWLICHQLTEKIDIYLTRLNNLGNSLGCYQEGTTQDPIPYIPEELSFFIREICYFFAKLLAEDKKIVSLFSGDDYQYLIKKNRDPRNYNLSRVAGSIKRDCDWTPAPYAEKMRQVLDLFIQINLKTQGTFASADLSRFEQLVKGSLNDLNYEGPISKALVDKALIEKVMELPWVKNQSWNKNRIVQLVEICNHLQLMTKPLS